MTESPQTFSATDSPPTLGGATAGGYAGTSMPGTATTGASANDASVKDKAAEAAGAAKQAGSDVASTAADKAKDIAAETQRQARDLVGEARNQVQGQVGDQHRNLVKNIRSLGDELSGMAQSSQQSQEQPGIAGELISQAGERAHGVADWLDGRDPSQLVNDVRSFARRRPGVFLAGALVAGIAVGRLTRGVVAAHTESSEDSLGSSDGYSAGFTGSTYAGSTYGDATTPLPTTPTASSEPVGYTPTNATGYSTPPTGTGVAETGPSAGYGGVSGGLPGTLGETGPGAPTDSGMLPGTPPGFGEPR